MKVVVHIEELALHGFAPSDRYAIGDAVQQTLVDLLRTTPSARLMELRAAEALLAPEAKRHARHDATGRAIAGAVHAALTGPRR